jgi:hypothetical protein
MLILGTDEKEGRNGVKSAIIKIHSMEWPLSLKALHYLVSRKYALGVSYQAVHKAAKELIEVSVIEKNGRGYCLNKQWILQVKSFGIETEMAYSRVDGKQNEFELVASLLNPRN